jgi:hypothetical protein
MIEVEEEKKKLNEFLRDFLVYYAEKNPSFKKAFIEFVKMRNAFDLFGIETKKEEKEFKRISS